jgi:hypothetical protein
LFEAGWQRFSEKKRIWFWTARVWWWLTLLAFMLWPSRFITDCRMAGRVVVRTVAKCAGVTELLQRKAGPWFGQFAKAIKHQVLGEASLSETLDVVMVGTYAWRNGSDKNASGELVSSLTKDGMLCKKVSSFPEKIF